MEDLDFSIPSIPCSAAYAASTSLLMKSDHRPKSSSVWAGLLGMRSL